jgi:plastocyanin
VAGWKILLTPKTTNRSRTAGLLFALLPALCMYGVGQGVTVTGHVTAYGDTPAAGSPDTVVWLTPVAQSGTDAVPAMPMHAVLRQKNKSFEPHLLVVTKGSSVDFPNLDPWFHNVFSLFNGKRFDLGLYEAGTSRTVHFDREGVSYIFCNIHPEMSGVVVVVPSPYYAIAGKGGDFSVGGVPPGKYTLHVWSENALPETLEGLTRQVEINGTTQSVGTLRVRESETAKVQHKNKYGRDYEPPSPSNPVYTQP